MERFSYILLYTFRSDAMLTMRPYESVGTCIINYVLREIKGIVCHNVNLMS